MSTRIATIPNPAAMMAVSDARSGSSDRKMPPVAPPRSSSAQHPAANGRRGGGYPIENPHSPPTSASASSRLGHVVDAYRADPNGREDRRGSSKRGNSRQQIRDSMSVPVRPYPVGPTSTHATKPQSEGTAVVEDDTRRRVRDERALASQTQAQAQAQVQAQAQAQARANPHARIDVNDAAEALNRVMLEEDLREMNRGGVVQTQAPGDAEETAEAPSVPTEHEGGRPEGRGARHDQGRREKITKFGDYDLGNTLGEGEFGKVKLGWKQRDGGNNKQYAIKLIKKDTIGDNPTRLAKVWREVSILRRASHPNIVKLVDTQKDRRYIGIILEYASGGELFDFILSHRSLKENVARRLFAQLVSGVGYLHKQGIVHRDLKLENLLLDKNRNIIITDFGFANTFDASEALSEEEELNLSNKDYVKKLGIDKVRSDGTRKGDLMQTSCGSPCYAAPELVISDALYTGRKVDVWSCGVILYAMLAGYLPFDDDPANPEGDNINQLYRYIVSTPLTFPEPVGPGARDLLRRILVPNPRKRADLFEVARHSWLSEFANVVELITSATTSSAQIQNSTVPTEELAEASFVARSTSVREPARPKVASPVIGGLVSKHGGIDPGEESATKKQKAAKRRTVQVEYVAPQTQTRRGEISNPPVSGGSGGGGGGGGSKTRVRSRSREPTDTSRSRNSIVLDKPLPDPPQKANDGHRSGRHIRPPGRSGRDGPYATAAAAGPPKRSPTGGPSHTALSPVAQSQPAPPKVAGAIAHGRIHQPGDQPDENQAPHPQAIRVPNKPVQAAALEDNQSGSTSTDPKTAHRRSTTLTDISSKILGRNGTLFGRRKRPEGDKSRRYPPTSMTNPIPAENPRQSMDSRISRRSLSLGFGRRRSGSLSGDKASRRFSFLPMSVSRAMGMNRDTDATYTDGSNQDLSIHDVQTDDDSHHARQGRPRKSMALYDEQRESDRGGGGASSSSPAVFRRPSGRNDPQGFDTQAALHHVKEGGATGPDSPSASSVEAVEVMEAPRRRAEPEPTHHQRRLESDGRGDSRGKSGLRNTRDLSKHKRLTDGGGAARRVMDLFRVRGRERGG